MQARLARARGFFRCSGAGAKTLSFDCGSSLKKTTAGKAEDSAKSRLTE